VKGRPGGTAEFVLIGDGRQLWSSGPMRVGDAARACRVDLAGVKLLELVVTDGGDHNHYDDHADWAEARIEADGVSTFATISRVAPAPYILTPPPPARPRINGARVFGVRPGSPFLFAVPATGDRPMKFAARGLPAGLRIDSEIGHITGILAEPGSCPAECALRRHEGAYRLHPWVRGTRRAL
jgi:alpha-galactosidase